VRSTRGTRPNKREPRERERERVRKTEAAATSFLALPKTRISYEIKNPGVWA